ncbi:hypothetical protein Pan97_25550 [Bremerella volcania]|uniref:Uncharacterized protein n=1 Tax=Bremerella volcania TaxID=2527984 RepID=A0A518C8I9_9BACT|nr:hypothetical protein [Bremerella volcania]QDU75522.1 hypothetical protein Pan97_25550 [Bremerella volcania]
MQRLARLLVRIIVILVGGMSAAVFGACLGGLVASWFGGGLLVCQLSAIYTGVAAGCLGMGGGTLFMDEWEKRSPVVTLDQVVDWWHWWKNLLRDPLRGDRFLGKTAQPHD